MKKAIMSTTNEPCAYIWLLNVDFTHSLFARCEMDLNFRFFVYYCVHVDVGLDKKLNFLEVKHDATS